MVDQAILTLATRLLSEMPLLWSFVLLLTRFTSMFITIPGIGGGFAGTVIRYPAAITLALVSTAICKPATLPPDIVMLTVALVGEISLGFLLGLFPLLIINGISLGGQLAATTMGLQASALIDPSTQTSVPDLAKIFADLSIILFLLLDGHHLIIYAASGYGGAFEPGTFFLTDNIVMLLVNRSEEMLSIGIMIAAPVLVALLGTNLVLGLISKSVPTLNIFIVSFPLTIGIGLVLSSLMLPEILELARGKFTDLQPVIEVMTVKN